MLPPKSALIPGPLLPMRVQKPISNCTHSSDNPIFPPDPVQLLNTPRIQRGLVQTTPLPVPPSAPPSTMKSIKSTFWLDVRPVRYVLPDPVPVRLKPVTVQPSTTLLRMAKFRFAPVSSQPTHGLKNIASPGAYAIPVGQLRT